MGEKGQRPSCLNSKNDKKTPEISQKKTKWKSTQSQNPIHNQCNGWGCEIFLGKYRYQEPWDNAETGSQEEEGKSLQVGILSLTLKETTWVVESTPIKREECGIQN